ncbi:MAG: hypothetical protein K6E50_00140 [Lachnospiraceae bacterium]|nr:hypothetical protein [Lachnospiraceae bacterium]
MIKKLTQNLGLKLLALLVSFALWLIIINYADPVVSTSFSNVRVEIVNADSLTSKGKVYEILNDSDTVNVEVFGKRSVLESLSFENIHAVADLEGITIMNTVAIQVTSSKNNDQLDRIAQSRAALELSVENLREIPLTVSVVTAGVPAEGYIKGDVTQTQNIVRVSGPESVVERISRAACSVNVEGRSSDLSTSADIHLFDAAGDLVTHRNLKMNISAINVGVEILPTKAVDIVYYTSGNPAEGYTVVGKPSAERTAVYIAGRSSALSGIDSLVVPGAALSVEGASESFSRQLDLKEFLPSDVRLVVDDVEGFDGNIDVNVVIEALVNRSFNIPIRNLVATGIPEGYEAEVLVPAGEEETGEEEDRPVYLRIRLSGVESSFDGLIGTNIKATIDVAAYLEQNHITEPEEGIYQIAVEPELPDDLEPLEVYYVDVRLKKTEE